MEDSAKGFYITLVTIGIFILCITQFIFMFPVEQGIDFSASSNGQEAQQYLTMGSMNTSISTQLTEMNNQSEEGFNQWDVTQGFMGSNSIKQSNKQGLASSIKNIFTSLTTMGNSLFGENSPVMIVLGILLTASLGYLVYVIVKWVRTGL